MTFLLLNKCILYSVSKPIYHNFEGKKTILWNNLSMQGKVIFSLKNIFITFIMFILCNPCSYMYQSPSRICKPLLKIIKIYQFLLLRCSKKSWDLHIWLVTWLQINHRNVWWYMLLHNLINSNKCYRIFFSPNNNVILCCK